MRQAINYPTIQPPKHLTTQPPNHSTTHSPIHPHTLIPIHHVCAHFPLAPFSSTHRHLHTFEWRIRGEKNFKASTFDRKCLRRHTTMAKNDRSAGDPKKSDYNLTGRTRTALFDMRQTKSVASTGAFSTAFSLLSCDALLIRATGCDVDEWTMMIERWTSGLTWHSTRSPTCVFACFFVRQTPVGLVWRRFWLVNDLFF